MKENEIKRNSGEPVILYRNEYYSKAFTGIMGNIENDEGENTIRSILVTSSVAGEGASTIALNFAAVLAAADTGRVLLVDADLRHPVIHKVLGVSNSAGFSDILFGNADAGGMIKSSGVKNLDVIPAGSFQANLNRVFSKNTFKRALGHIAGDYDHIVFDSPPVTVFPDAAAIAGGVDGVLLVIAAHRTRWEIIEGATRKLNKSGAHLLGTILNKRRFVIPSRVYKRIS
jgi:succinoglycan biosynthesis transport protein ExoP